MGTQQRDAWGSLPLRPDSAQKPLAEWRPIGIVLECGKQNPELKALGIPHKPCDRARGHNGACYLEAL